ncbi:MAG: hypothetical protein ABR985_07685 [Methanotrichaceae archaeon]|jgi:hypothetical protein
MEDNSIPCHESYWHTKLSSIEGGSQEAVILALMYFVLGEDYAYHMASQFAKELTDKNLWKDEQIKKFKLKILKNKSGPLSTLLNQMEKNKLLIAREDMIGKHKRKYFSINPAILLCPDDSRQYFVVSSSEFFEITTKEIDEYLKELKKKNVQELKVYLKQWSSIRKFDFVTFLEFLMAEADKRKKKTLSDHFSRYITELNRLERDGRRGKGIKCGTGEIHLVPSEVELKLTGRG